MIYFEEFFAKRKCKHIKKIKLKLYNNFIKIYLM